MKTGKSNEANEPRFVNSAGQPEAGSPSCIAEGVFFTTPPALPRGRHNLSNDQVLAAQRERLMIAMTELMAAGGYRSFGIREIVKRSGVSLEAFYSAFNSKDACVFAGYHRFIRVLLDRLYALPLSECNGTDLICRIVGTYLDTLSLDLVVARAYQVEIDAMGQMAREQRRESLSLFAHYMDRSFKEISKPSPPPAHLNYSAYLAVVYSARQQACDLLDSEPEPDLMGLKADVSVWLQALFSGQGKSGEL